MSDQLNRVENMLIEQKNLLNENNDEQHNKIKNLFGKKAKKLKQSIKHMEF